MLRGVHSSSLFWDTPRDLRSVLAALDMFFIVSFFFLLEASSGVREGGELLEQKKNMHRHSARPRIDKSTSTLMVEKKFCCVGRNKE